MREKRGDKRQQCFYYLDLIDCDNIHDSGKLIDISTSGLRYVSKTRHETDSLKRMRLTFPETTFGKDWVEFNARVVWSGLDTNDDYFASGVMFENLDNQDALILKKAMEDYLFDN